MANNWKKIWNKRESMLANIDLSDTKEVFLELKRINGFDIADGGVPYDEWIKKHAIIKQNLKYTGGYI